jgi:hypothetical protein
MSFCSHNACERAAYHESGHIVFAYLNGYSCEGVQLDRSVEMDKEIWSGQSRIDYHTDAFIVSKLIGVDADADFFEQVPHSTKQKAVAVARRLARVYLAGSLTEAIYENGGDPNVPFPIETEWLDLIRVEYLNYALEKMDGQHQPAEFIPSLFTNLLKAVESPDIWYAIESIARKLRVTKRMNRSQIEEILETMQIIGMHPKQRA